MMNFIQNPNLPCNEVSLVISGYMYKEITDLFRKRGIDIIFVQKNTFIDSAISTHADVAVLHTGGRNFLVDSFQTELVYELREISANVQLSEKPIVGTYPNDVALNFAFLGKYVIGNFKYADTILNNCLQEKICINVKQGYAKCSCLVVNDTALITDDESIYNEAFKFGLDCLLVRKGDILLDGHEYGFIGGASGKISGREIVFFGDVKKHRDYEIIKAFIEKHGCKIISFEGIPLTDFGGIIPIAEKI